MKSDWVDAGTGEGNLADVLALGFKYGLRAHSGSELFKAIQNARLIKTLDCFPPRCARGRNDGHTELIGISSSLTHEHRLAARWF